MDLPEQIRQFVEQGRPRYPTPRALLVPTLMECQKHFGYVSPETVLEVAQLVGVPFSEVQSVVSFYAMLTSTPVGRFVIAVCRTWNCAHAGAGQLVEHFNRKYGARVGETVAGGLFTLVRTECLADCHNAPSVQVVRPGREFRAWWANNLTVELFDRILEDLAADKDDALRERLVRVEHKANPPDERHWIWLVTTNNQYPAWIEEKAGEQAVHDAFGKLGRLRDENPKLLAEIQGALREQ